MLTSEIFLFQVRYFFYRTLYYPCLSPIEGHGQVSASINHWVPFIYDANRLGRYDVTRFLSDGYFQAYCSTVSNDLLSYATSWLFRILARYHGCFRFDLTHFAEQVCLGSSPSSSFPVNLGSVRGEAPSPKSIFTWRFLFWAHAANAAFVEN